MIVDFRYHVVSLAAVFLALGVGILIGGAILGNAALQKELGQIEQNLAKLRNDQRAFQDEIAKREAELKASNQFGAAVLPVLVRNKLLGKRVALVRTNPSTDPRLVKDLVRLFQIAGSKVTSTTAILRDPADIGLDRLVDLGGKVGLSAPDAAALSREILRLAIDRIANGPISEEPGSDVVLSSLSAARLIEIGGDYREMVDILVIVGGSRDPNIDLSQKVDRTLIDTLAGSKGLMVAAVEPSDVARSYLTEYVQHPLIIVDNIETTAGQAALILALVRGRKGHYGIRGAHQLLPEVF